MALAVKPAGSTQRASGTAEAPGSEIMLKAKAKLQAAMHLGRRSRTRRTIPPIMVANLSRHQRDHRDVTQNQAVTKDRQDPQQRHRCERTRGIRGTACRNHAGQ